MTTVVIMMMMPDPPSSAVSVLALFSLSIFFPPMVRCSLQPWSLFSSSFLTRRHPVPTPKMFEPLLRTASAVGLTIDTSTSKALAESLDQAQVSGWLGGWVAVCLAGWMAGWLAVCLAGWLAGWLATCLPACLPACLSICPSVRLAVWPSG